MTPPNETYESGLPVLTPADTQAKYGPLIILTLAPLVVGLGFAYAIYTIGPTDVYDVRIDAVRAADLHWACAACVVLGRTVAFVMCYPQVRKGRFLTASSRALWANPFIYSEIGAGASKQAIVLVDDGAAIGKLNRANRSLYDMIESCGVALAGLFLVSTVFPEPAFAATCAFALGWTSHAVNYSLGGASHGLGYVLAAFATATIEGMLALISLKACEVV
ncbi:Aste57867_10367 [Aphanomyces stellatus]|uniref:Aste57867_10367 protein n=1 Tax=Aphanomyces stellatus TaxID=120398 RepID=A0A485KQU3_9STRA|nr:hypothetical protein As57867_010327 [Aphanomyces stellatus]VFT87241.1 Aste57867_10367 [Aphanomyces stellatus]